MSVATGTAIGLLLASAQVVICLSLWLAASLIVTAYKNCNSYCLNSHLVLSVNLAACQLQSFMYYELLQRCLPLLLSYTHLYACVMHYLIFDPT